MADGHGYTFERREQFFKEDWPVIKATMMLFLDKIEGHSVPPPHLVGPTIEKMTRVLDVFVQIIEDDQAELIALRAIAKAMEKK